MKQSLVQGLSEKDMQAVINTYTLNDFYWPTLFPLKFTPTLTWKELTTGMGIPVMADVVSFNATAPRKTRRVVSRNQGDIPKIDIAFDKQESDINEYNQLVHYAGSDQGQKALLDWIYGDVDSAWKGVNARIEWLALRALSTGRIVLNKDNNEGIVTEEAVTFGIPDEQKLGVTKSWRGNPTEAKPIAFIKALRKKAKAKGTILEHAFCRQEVFDDMVATAEVQKFCAGWVSKATNTEVEPSLESFNKVMQKNKLPQFHIIESIVTVQINGKDTIVEPFEDGVITFTPTIVQGNTYHAPLADESVKTSVALRTKREHVLIKRFSTEEPVVETTKGMANAFPVWGNAQKCWLVDTLHTSWDKESETSNEVTA